MAGSVETHSNASLPGLPEPGRMVSLSPTFTPAQLQGMTIHPDNALQFDFLVNKGDQDLEEKEQKIEYKKLVKYFLTALTVPNQNQWVNLSPYEKDRIIQDDFGQTEMGRDLLAQDYLLKQITSSLMYPETGLGKEFWDKIYAAAQEKFGTSNVPVDTFNKVWIVPDEAAVYESGNTVYILNSHLKVMLGEDYLSLTKNSVGAGLAPAQNTRATVRVSPTKDAHQLSSQIIKEVILPILEKEVNEGKNFAQLRQVVSGMVLATWYKKALKESLLGKIYMNKAKVNGITQADPKMNEAIYRQYLAAFKKGVYNYIKEDSSTGLGQAFAPRKYFAGGVMGMPDAAMTTVTRTTISKAAIQGWLNYGKPALAQVVVSLRNILYQPLKGNRRALIAGAAAYGILGKMPEAEGKNVNQPKQVPRAEKVFTIQSGTMTYAEALQLVKGMSPVDFKEGRSVEHRINRANPVLVVSPVKSKSPIFAIKMDGKVLFKVSKGTPEGFYIDQKWFWDKENQTLKYENYWFHTGSSGLMIRDPNYLKLSDKAMFSRRSFMTSLTAAVGVTLPKAAGAQVLQRLGLREIRARIGEIKKEGRMGSYILETTSSPGLRINYLYRGKKYFIDDIDNVIGFFIKGNAFYVFYNNDAGDPTFLSTELLGNGAKSVTDDLDVSEIPSEVLPELGIGKELKAAIQEKFYGVMQQLNIPSKIEAGLRKDSALVANNPGGIDVNPDRMRFTDLKRDGKGVVLPFSRQDMAQLSQITGFDPEIIKIKDLTAVPILSELQQALAAK